ncbi:MAG: response regulator [Nitrospirae bacterium]|nr:response regulator [Nitrospirota bacterium]
MELDLRNKKILLVDDFSEFRFSVKKMLQSGGAANIDDVSNGEDAIDRMSRKNYDIILCDYNLGQDKKDGQQILEEAKHRGFLKTSTLFIMVTAENTMDMVMGAIEYQPDDYMTKPFTKEVLNNRVSKLLEKKHVLKDIEKAVSREDYKRAIALCDAQLAANPKNAMELFRIKSDALLSLGQYDDAINILEKVLSSRDLPWARLGIGKIYFQKKNYIEAKEHFQEIIGNNKAYMEAYDWLSKTLVELGDQQSAQKTLEEAVALSPKAILRQRALGELALKNNDHDTAEKSFKKSVAMGKTSIYKSAKDYTGLAKTVMNAKKNPVDALTILKDAEKDFQLNPEVMMQTAAMEGVIYKKIGHEGKAKEAIDKASALMEEHGAKVSPDVAMDVAKSFFDVGETEKGQKVMHDIVQNNHDDEAILKKVQDAFDDANLKDVGKEMIASTKQEIIKINNEGVNLVKKGMLVEAIEVFDKAADGLPQNKIVNANAAQALIMIIQKNGKNDKYIYQCKKYLDRLRKIDPNYPKFQQLVKIFGELNAV